ncbi:MAG TPA: hypothetical protein VGI99_02905, partial [Gemmataceae bacterium]
MLQDQSLGFAWIAANDCLDYLRVFLIPEFQPLGISGLDLHDHAVNLIPQTFQGSQEFSIAVELAQQQVKFGIEFDVSRYVARLYRAPLSIEIPPEAVDLARGQVPGDGANDE